MPTSSRKNYLWYSFAILVFGLSISVSAQTQPFLQDIQVKRDTPLPSATPYTSSPYIKKTSSVDVVMPAAISHSPIVTTIPVLENFSIPGYTGVLVETLDGEKVVESGSNLTYNPASNVKVATTYAVIKTFGPDYRFATSVWTDGSWEASTGTIHGNLYVSGRDPVFGFEHAVALAHGNDPIGIRAI